MFRGHLFCLSKPAFCIFKLGFPLVLRRNRSFERQLSKLSIESPLGRVLMGKQEDDDVEFRTPRGDASARVAAIRYEYDD